MMHVAYHPAFDPYHTTLRLLQILYYNPLKSYERDRVRMLDFFFVFPQQIKAIRLPKEYRREQGAASERPNPYHFSGTTAIVFSNMASWQDAALRLLLAKGMINRVALEKDDTVMVTGELSPILREIISVRNAGILPRLSFLVDVLDNFPLRGKDGLKDRAGVMSYKYDSL